MPTKLMIVFGTRPEAIKLAPLVLKARQDPRFEPRVVVTAQHRQMLDEVLAAFDLVPDVDLDVMVPGQSIFHVASTVLLRMESLLEREKPDVVVVQGDTTTTYMAAVAAFFARTKVAHVEAGLRTGDKWAPFPEEMNRKMTSAVVDFHFPPTEGSRQNLLDEGYPADQIHVTGNTVIDALLDMAARVEGKPCPIAELEGPLADRKRMVLITGHRRESFGEPFRRICQAFRSLAEAHPDVLFVYPVHLNPNVQAPVKAILSGLDNFLLIEPLAYPPFVWLLKRSTFIITDSGGIQEEAPSLGKPVLVTRRVTERPEGVAAGVVRLVGDDPEVIVEQAQTLLTDEAVFRAMARGENPYGDGKACGRILDVIAEGR